MINSLLFQVYHQGSLYRTSNLLRILQIPSEILNDYPILAKPNESESLVYIYLTNKL